LDGETQNTNAVAAEDTHEKNESDEVAEAA